MARSQAELQAILAALDGVEMAAFQPPPNQAIVYPAVIYERDDSFTTKADNILWFLKKRYTVTVIDRKPDSLIPDQVENLPYASFDRFFIANGLNHFVYQLFF